MHARRSPESFHSECCTAADYIHMPPACEGLATAALVQPAAPGAALDHRQKEIPRQATSIIP
jgi:hypothetical protein